jgi:hypothetical protein
MAQEQSGSHPTWRRASRMLMDLHIPECNTMPTSDSQNLGNPNDSQQIELWDGVAV